MGSLSEQDSMKKQIHGIEPNTGYDIQIWSQAQKS